MQFLRKAALAAAASLLTITLFSFGPAFSTYQTFHSPGAIKGALKGSGIYGAAVPALLNQQQKNSASEGEGSSNSIPFDRPEIQQIVKAAFTPSFLQAQSEYVLDSAYKWLGGDTKELEFSIDLSSAKASMAGGLAQYALDRLNSLPACTGAAAITTTDIDAFNATCVPAGVDKNAIANEVRAQFDDDEFLQDTISASNLKTDNGKPVTESVKDAPQAFQAAQAVIAGVAFAAVLWATAVVFLGATRRSGIRKAAIVALTTGIVGACLAVLSNFAVHKFVHKALADGNTDVLLRPQLVSILQSLADDLRNWWIIYSAVLVVLAVGALLALHFTAPKDVLDLSGPPQKHPKKGGAAAEDLPSQDTGAVRHEHVVTPPQHNGPESGSADKPRS